jgi:hypothetical protein
MTGNVPNGIVGLAFWIFSACGIICLFLFEISSFEFRILIRLRLHRDRKKIYLAQRREERQGQMVAWRDHILRRFISEPIVL